jgi:5-methylcytosine-specific restriction endonuclease McrA
MKTCTKCLQEFPSTTEYFTVDKRKKGGLGSECRPCKNKRMSIWVKNNPQKQNERVKKWNRKNPEQARHIWRQVKSRRNARKKGNGWEFYTEQKVLEKYGYNCSICNLPIDLTAPRRTGKPGWENGLHIDHVVAISNGGPDTLANVRPAHGLCNLNKSNKEIYEKA